MSRKNQFVCLLAFLGLLFTATPSGFAQSLNGPLNFGNNYFVTGDYVVAGAQGMNVNIAGGYAVGTIAVPDSNPGITGASSVPPGAEVVAALLYWQTVEKTGTVPGQAGSGENGYFMPVGSGGPKAPGYPITGVNLASSDTVPYSSSGCTSASTGEVVRTYRANVLGALPRDSTGNISANGIYGVYLPSVRNSTPLTLGATLVIIYRILSPSVPLNSIVIYDGAYAPGTTSLTMKQTMQGFYDAAPGPVSRLTHIVGQGKGSKVETVYLNNTVLPSLYGRSPAFPGYYGTWDNPTWTFNPAESYLRVANPILAGAASATTEVIPYSSGEGCLSWGAVIVSTTVLNSDGDGLLDSWKVKPASYANPGYCDASVKEGVCTPGSASWVDLPGALHGEKDVFIQLDYMCSEVLTGDTCATGDGTNYSFDPRPSGAIGLVTGAFTANPGAHPAIHLHINPTGTNQPDIHAIPDSSCTDVPATSTAPLELCSFPDQPGVVAWKGGFDFIKNQLVDSSDMTSDCTGASPAASCMPRFQPGKRTSWHYVLSAHAVGQPEWKLQDDSLEIAKQSGNTVTFTTAAAVGTLNTLTGQSGGPQDPSCSYGRVTILGAATNSNLNGTFCLASSANPTGTSFAIKVGGSATTATYTYNTDPNLAVAPGFTSTASGVSDVGGADSLITLGLWGNPAFNGANSSTMPVSDGQSEPVLAGTFMHELGHSLGLTHGGYTYPYQAIGNYVPTLLPNCKPNFQSVMNYAFQVGLLTPAGGTTTNIPDYSGQVLASLNEAKAGVANVFSSPSPAYSNTAWYVPYSGVGSPATMHCNGTPITNGAKMSVMPAPTNTLSWASGQDINFDGNTSETLQGYNDWANVDFRQISATGTNSTTEGGGQNFGGGGQNFGGGGQNFGGGGQNLGGGGQNFGGGGQNLGGGGQNFGGGGQNFGGGGEVNVATANSVTYPPRNLMASEGASPRAIGLNWLASIFGQIGQYKVYRALKGGAFSVIGTVTGNPPALTYTDTSASCNATGYQYFVTAVLSSASPNSGQESVGSNTVTTGSNGAASGQGALTGCYTNTPPTVSLTSLSVPNTSFVQGSTVPVTWSLQDDYNTTGTYVGNLLANSLVAIGPFSSDQGCPASLPTGGTVTQLLTKGVIQTGTGASAFGFSAATNQFTFTWDTTPFNAGCYFFTLTLDSTQTETTTSPLTVLIYVSGGMPHITTTTLTPGTVGSAYTSTIYEAGGVSPFTWTVSAGSTPPGISLGSANGVLSGTSCVAGPYNFTAKVTDSKSNFGTQALMLQIQRADTTTSVVPTAVSPPANPSVYGQPVTFTVTVAPQSPCTPPTGTVTLLDGTTPIASNLTLSGGMATFTTSLLSVAGHSITATYSGDPNFNATGSDAGSKASILTQTVNKADTATSVMSSLNASTYGQAVTFTATVSAVSPGAGTPTGTVTFKDGSVALAGSSTVMLSGGTAMFTTTNTQLTAGGHSITAVYNDDSNFKATDSDAGSKAIILNQMVNKADTATSVISSSISNTSTYGQAVTFTATVSVVSPGAGTPTGTVMFEDGGAALAGGTGISVSVDSFTTAITELMAGGHTITVVYNGDSNFNATGSGAATPLSQTVNQASLAATVTGWQVYGGTSLTFEVNSNAYSGFVNGETSSSAHVTGTLTGCASTANSTSGAGSSYSVVAAGCTGLSAPNYSISYAGGTFTVKPAPLTATIVGTQVYGGTSITYMVSSYSPFVSPDTALTAVSGALAGCGTSATSMSNVGSSYTVMPAGCTGLIAPNYQINYLGGPFSVTPAPLTIAAQPSSKTYDGTTGSTVAPSPSGLVGTDNVTVLAETYASPNVGTGETLSVSPGYVVNDGNSGGNYTVTTQTSTAGVITPAPLTAIVTGTSPTFSVGSYVGFVDNFDTSSLVVGTLTCTTLATDTAGNTTISCSGLSAPNYIIVYSYAATADSTPNPEPLTVAVNGTQTFGGTPVFTLTYSGFISGDLPGVVTGTLSCSTDATALSPVGTSPAIHDDCAGLIAPSGYSISYLPGTVTIIPAPLTVIVSESGGGSPTFTAAYSGFVNGDTSSVLGGKLACTVNASADSEGNKPLSCSGVTAPSYYAITYSFAPASVGTIPAPLTVAVSGTQVGATGNPTFTITYSGFAGGDLPLDIAGTLSCTTSPGATATSYTITGCSGLSAPVTYISSLTYWLGKVKVTAAP